MTRLALSVSGTPTNWSAGYTPGTTLYGTTGSDQLAANAPNMTLVGNGGDDTFIVYDPGDVVIELPNSGISTVETWGSGYSLPANIQNLTLEGSADAYAAGNSLDNIITANAGDDRIIAGTGDDILIGGTGDDTFVITAGDGLDEIQGFHSGDVVQLQGFSFSSFADVQAAMAQSGTDVVLNLGGGQSITFDNTTVGSFTANDFDLPFRPAGTLMSFDDEFNALSLNAGGQSGLWDTTFDGGIRTLAKNGELEEDMDPSFAGTGTQPLSVNPFSDDNGVLTISAQPTSPTVAPYIGNMPYTSGVLTTEGTFAQTYGYWEISAELPKGDGLWPAFWLLPADHSWPPEVDIFEALGSDTSTVVNSFHGADGTDYSQATHVNDLSVGFHTFGFDWTPSMMTWFVDGLQTLQLPTPASMNKPMYMLMDLAVGGDWPGAPDASTQFPASLKIDYVHVYSSAQTGASASPSLVPSANDLTGNGLSDALMTASNGAVVLDQVSSSKMGYTQISAIGPEWQFEGSGALLGDGHNQFILWYGSNDSPIFGSIVVGEDDGGAVSYTKIGAIGPEWQFEGVGALAGGSSANFLLWDGSSASSSVGAVVVGTISGGSASYTQIGSIGPEWKFEGVGGFLNNGSTDFLIWDTNKSSPGYGSVVAGQDVGGTAQYTAVGGLDPAAWQFEGSGDLLNDGKDSILIRNANSGALVAGEVDNGSLQYTAIGAVGPEWQFLGVGNYDGKSPAEFLMWNGNGGSPTGALVIGTIAGGSTSYTDVGGVGPNQWTFHLNS